jgi:enoyl-CoA hydratase/carnithine racemase
MAILFEPRGNVLVLTINRPEAMNAVDPETDAELAEAWQRFDADPALRAAVLTGAGDKAFSAGADLKKLIPYYRDQARRGEDPVWNFGGLTRGFETSKPIVAAINGHCLAGGLELALACDVRLCSPNARFGLAEVRWAIIPGAGGTQRLPRSVPLGIAMEMILSGEPIDAQEAYRVGLVNRILALPDLLAGALRVAETIAARGPLAVRAAKRAVLEGLQAGFHDGMRLEQQLFRELMLTDDAVEGPRAFAERRSPVFKGT